MKYTYKTRVNQLGMTMIELLIAIAITGIFVFGFIGVSRLLQGQFTTHREVFETEQSVYFAMDTLIRDIREAKSVSSTSTASQIEYTDPNDVKVNYRINQNRLERQIGNGSFVLVSNNIDGTNSKFTYDSASSASAVTIMLKGLYNNNEVILENTVYLRNKNSINI